MKYDITKNNRFASRTLSSFSNTLLELLKQKSLESITVNEICKISNYPRATFYNYFDDLYDLLDYCWYVLEQEIDISDFKDIDENQRVYVMFDRLYEFLLLHNDDLKLMMKNNSLDGLLVSSFHLYMTKEIRRIMLECGCPQTLTIPYELVVDYYSNTIQLVIEYSFLRNKTVDKSTALKYLKYLLGE